MAITVLDEGQTTPDFKPNFYSGLSGLQLPIPKYLFPPPYENVSRLTYYATFFNSIEFNSSFYKIPRPATVSNWAASVPDNFRFTFKLWKGITHNKALDFNPEDVFTFFNSINSVKEKKGSILIQFPPSIGREYAIPLRDLLSCIQSSNQEQGWKVAVEFRNTSWYKEDIYELLNFYNATIVIQDIPKSATPIINHTSNFIYLRFHGPTGNYRESYSEDFLRENSSLIHDWINEGKTVYTYFNNTMGDAFKNLKLLNHLTQQL